MCSLVCASHLGELTFPSASQSAGAARSVMALAFEDFHLGGRVAATVRLTLDPESPSAHHRNCTTGVVS